MKLREAIEREIRYVRSPDWNQFSYLELPPSYPDGTHGPWAKLYDPVSTCVLQDMKQKHEYPISILEMQLSGDDWEEFTGERFTPDDIRAGKHVKGFV